MIIELGKVSAETQNTTIPVALDNTHFMAE
jgi:hypothetical protein